MHRRGSRKGQKPVLRNFDSLKRFYGIAPLPTEGRLAVPSSFVGAYSRRSCLGTYHVIGAPREQLVFDAMRTYTPTTCTKRVCHLFFEVAALVSVYYDTLDQLVMLPEV